jgi:transglutaminase-like putative cysteine protease
MSEIRSSRLPWRRASAAAPAALTHPAARPLLEHGAIPWLLVVALATTLPHAETLPWWLSLVSGLALFARVWLWLRNGRLPRGWMLSLLVLAGAAGIAWQYRSLFGRDPGVAMLVFFMAFKPMEMRTRRDGLVIVMLGFFLLLTHYFDSEGIVTGIWLLASATLLTAALLRMYGGAQPILGIFRYSAVLITQALPFALILFLLFPRVEGPLWGMPRDTYIGLTGLSDRMSPGSLNELILSGNIAFGVHFETDMPSRSQLYWRGPVFDSYDGQTWRASLTSAPRSGSKPVLVEPAGETRIGYTITLEAHNRNWLLALDMPVSLPEDASLTPALVAVSRLPVRFRARFAFRSAPNYVVNREEDAHILQQALILPRGLNPRTRELAESWQRAFTDPERISAAALRFFREEKFFYTLNPAQNLQPGTNAIDDFLFDTRQGFCEHYAGAYVTLMRAAGIPARVVIGYQGGELNPVDGYLTVRQSDAHAWSEIWLKGKGWKRVDPTAAIAPSRIESGLGAALPESDSLSALTRSGWLMPLQRLRFGWEAINNAWDQWVLGYNSKIQRETLANLGMENPDWQSMVSTMVLASGIALLLVVCWTLSRRAKLAPELRIWRRFCARLEGFGIRRALWEGPLDLAARVGRERPDIAPLVKRAAGHFAELRYAALYRGHREHLQALRDCIRELASFRKKPL